MIGQIITDGTATFIIDDARDGHRVGNILLDHIPRDGYVKANGAVLQAADYPRLVRFVVDNNLRVTEAEWQANMSGMYAYDEVEETLRVPDLRGMVLRGLDDGKGYDEGRVLGSYQGDAIRNITGYIYNGFLDTQSSGGAFTRIGGTNDYGAGAGGAWKTSLTFDVSRVVPTATENRMKNIALIAQIKY